MNNGFNWSSFRVRINIKAGREELYHAWATRKGIESWFLRMGEFSHKDGSLLKENEQVNAGDTYRWLWYGYPDETVEQGEILAANGSDQLSFRFGKAGNCHVSISSIGDQNLVELVQDDIPTDEKGKQNWHLGCKTGWTFYLANLKSIMEGGIDLRNRDERLQEMINS